MRTLGQERAEFALKRVVKSRSIDKLKTFSAGAPTVILQNGFGQAMAFWLSKGGNGENKYKFIFNSIKDWLTDEKKGFIKLGNSVENKDEAFAFVSKLSTISQRDYLAAQKEAVSLLEWIKRYAAAFCPDEDKNDNKTKE